MTKLDYDRIRDPELLRTIAKVQDAELRHHFDIMRRRECFWALKMGKSTEEIEQQLIELEEEIADRLHHVYGSGSERRPRKDKPVPPPKAPKKGHGPRPQPELLVEEKIHVWTKPTKSAPFGDQLPA